MSDFDPHISVETISTAKDAIYTIKEMTLDHLNRSVETPFKVLSGTNISRGTIGDQISGLPFPIFESEKYIIEQRSYAALNRILDEGTWVRDLNRLFGVDNGIVRDFNTTVSLVFRHYPLNDIELRNDPTPRERLDISQYEVLLDYVYAASSAFILTPDIYLPSSKRTFSIDEYLSLILRSVDAFERKNNKPIFVPLQVDLGVTDLKKILTEYQSQKYSNIWINFNAKACDNTYSARLRLLDRLLPEYLGEDYILYGSHMQKDIQPQLKNPVSVASDVLPQYLGTDFVGAFRNVYRSFRPTGQSDDEIASGLGLTTPEYQNARWQHSHRIFDPDTYYYCYPSAYPHRNVIKNIESITPGQLGLLNSIVIGHEFERVRDELLETNMLRPILSDKRGLMDNPKLLSNILSPRQQRSVQTTFSSSDGMDPFQFLGNIR